MLFNKRGQVTAWIIVAIVIVAAAVVAYALRPDLFRVGFSKQKASQILETQSANLQDSIAKCVGDAAKYCFTELGKHAGYYHYGFLPSIDYAGTKVVVMYKDVSANRINKLPSLQQILGQEFNDCMTTEGWDKVDKCVNFDAYKRYFSITELAPRQVTATADNENDIIRINVSWPMKLSKRTLIGSVAKTINQREVSLLIPLGKIWKVANDIVNYEMQQQDFIDVIEQYIGSHEFTMKNIRISSQNYPTYKQTIYLINTVPYRIGEEVYNFNFAVDRADYEFRT